MSKKQISKLRKPYYMTDEYGHTDAMLVKKINTLIDIVNEQQDTIRKLQNERRR